MPKKDDNDLPSTLKRSSAKAQRTWRETHNKAVEEYGEGERAHRTAFAALKHSFAKVGDHWELKSRKDPSDPRAAEPANAARAGKGKTYGGVDVLGSTKQELMDEAKKLGVRGYSNMTKDELGEAINRANTRKTTKARKSEE